MCVSIDNWLALWRVITSSSSLPRCKKRARVFRFSNSNSNRKKNAQETRQVFCLGFTFRCFTIWSVVYYIDTICVLFYFIFETALIIIFFFFSFFVFLFFVNNFEIFLRLFLFYFCFRSLFFVYSLFSCVCLFILFFFCILVACRRSGGCWSTELTTKRVAAATAVAAAASELGRAGDASSGSDSVSSRLAGWGTCSHCV